MNDPNSRRDNGIARGWKSIAGAGSMLALTLIAFAAVGGINGGGRVRGTITAFGSIFVNGVEYQMTTAQVRVDDNPGVESDLAVGQVVTVDGFVNDDGVTGRADIVEYESDVRGAIASVDLGTTSFTVLGQTVRVDSGTRFEASFVPANFSALRAGQIVEVSGYRNSAGQLVATFIGREDAPDDRVVGLVSELNEATHRFKVNGLMVDYSSAMMVEPGFANGALVEVEGPRAADGVLQARTIELEIEHLGGDDGDAAGLEGIVTRGLVSGVFKLNNQDVVVTTATRFVFGKRADLKPDVRVEVEGRFDASGRIVATKVKFEYEDDAYAWAAVEAINLTKKTISLNGLTVTLDASVKIEDKSSIGLKPFALRNLQVGDTVEVRGVESRLPRNVRAFELRRDDADGRTRIGGRVSAIRNREFDVLDLTVVTSSATRYRNELNQAITATRFFGTAANRDVKVRGIWNGTNFVAAEVQFEELKTESASESGG
jgi:hypothetical protein